MRRTAPTGQAEHQAGAADFLWQAAALRGLGARVTSTVPGMPPASDWHERARRASEAEQAAALSTLLALTGNPPHRQQPSRRASPLAGAWHERTSTFWALPSLQDSRPIDAVGYLRNSHQPAPDEAVLPGRTRSGPQPGAAHKRTARDQDRPPRRNPSTRAMNRPQRVQYTVLASLWLAAASYFWAWWVLPAHVGNPVLFWVLSVAWFYIVTVLPSFYLFYLGRMRRPVPVGVHRAEQAGVLGRVAVISLTVPGAESLDFVRRQLVAMKSIRYPHDSWILVDKEHSPEIKQLAAELGVHYFSRHDRSAWGAERVTRWNTPKPPFQAKTKAGNVNAWLDQYGDLYSHFTQLDIDHLPVPSYLDKVLGFFADPKVAWVQAPSVYGNHEHWTARGASEQEVVLQGPLQMGFFGFCRTPFIIGSHCTYDMAAIWRIGGFQPTRAEDHLDTVYLASEGREGVFLPEVIAVGDGPETFDIYLAQQFAWAFSLIQVLLRFTPRLIRRYSPRQAIQFLFAQTWYPLWSVSMLMVYTAPLLSLVFNAPISHVSLLAFLAHSIPGAVISTAVWWWSRSWHQPATVSLSWRGVVLHMARWVVVLSAFAQVALRVKKPYMITVKGLGDSAHKPFRVKVLMPYLSLIMAALASCWLYLAIHRQSSSQGYLLFALENAGLFCAMLLVLLIQDAHSLRREQVPVLGYLRLRARPVLTIVAMWGLLAATAVAAYEPILQALLRK